MTTTTTRLPRFARNDKKNGGWVESSEIIDAVRLVEEKKADIPWLLEGVVPAGGLVLLAGENSSGKSLLALELALGVALGANTGEETKHKPALKVWGLPCALRGKARYLCADADQTEIARRVGRLCAAKGIEVPKELSFDFGRHVFDDNNFGTLERTIAREGIRLVIVDPLSRYLPWMNDSSMRSVGTGLQAMRDLARKTGATIVMLQGFNKLNKSRLNKYGQPTTDGSERVRGSSELVASCDVSLLVTRGNTRNIIELVKNRQGRRPWASFFSIVDGTDAERAVLHIIFEKLSLVEVKPPDTLAELVERRFKKVMRREPKRQFTRAELIRETEKLVGDVGKRSLAKAFVLLGRDADVRVELGEQNRKLYGLAMPVKAFYDSVLEEEGQLAAVDMLSKKLSVDAPLILLEEQFKERDESKKKVSVLDEIIQKLKDEDT